MLGVVMLCVIKAKCCICIVMLSVIMLCVVILTVVGPQSIRKSNFGFFNDYLNVNLFITFQMPSTNDRHSAFGNR